jgi:AmmeMemoRadiSam system protein A
MKEEHKKVLLSVARKSIELYLDYGEQFIPDKDSFPDREFWQERGSFVTLTINEELRGCIGTIIPYEPLIIDVAKNAVNAAFRDPRFYPLTKEEFPFVDIEVSVLTYPEKVNFNGAHDLFAKIRKYEDGVIIKRGFYQATYLPQVWRDIPDKEQFFRTLCLKAGMESECFKDPHLEVFTYRVEAFSEKEFKD